MTVWASPMVHPRKTTREPWAPVTGLCSLESFSIINTTKMETRNKMSKSSKAPIFFKTTRSIVIMEKQHYVVKSWIFTGSPAAGSEPAWEAQGSPDGGSLLD